ncbi:unnamed protein product, partial [Amoebophrya sp. A25]|eukprot:GSA25T00027005001.1
MLHLILCGEKSILFQLGEKAYRIMGHRRCLQGQYDAMLSGNIAIFAPFLKLMAKLIAETRRDDGSLDPEDFEEKLEAARNEAEKLADNMYQWGVEYA